LPLNGSAWVSLMPVGKLHAVSPCLLHLEPPGYHTSLLVSAFAKALTKLSLNHRSDTSGYIDRGEALSLGPVSWGIIQRGGFDGLFRVSVPSRKSGPVGTDAPTLLLANRYRPVG